MTFIATPDCARLSIVGTLNGQTYVNTLWFLYVPGDPTITNMTELADDVEAWWTASMSPYFTAGLQMSSITVIDQSAQDAPSITTVAAMAGTQGDDPTPNNVAVVASFRTANRGRGARGRNYLGGIPITKLTDMTHITGGYAVQLIGAYNALQPAVTADSWQHVVVSHYLNKQARAQGLAQPVTSIIVDTALDSARRRLAGRGT